MKNETETQEKKPKKEVFIDLKDFAYRLINGIRYSRNSLINLLML